MFAYSHFYISYMNNLYIYPTALSIAKGAGVSARNIGLSIKLLENDDDPSAAGLKVYSSGHTNEGNLYLCSIGLYNNWQWIF